MPRLVLVLAAMVTLAFARDGFAQNKPPVVVWPTLTPAGDATTAVPMLRPTPLADKDVFDRAQELDATLLDALHDLGFTLYVTDTGPMLGHVLDQDPLTRAAPSAACG